MLAARSTRVKGAGVEDALDLAGVVRAQGTSFGALKAGALEVDMATRKQHERVRNRIKAAKHREREKLRFDALALDLAVVLEENAILRTKISEIREQIELAEREVFLTSGGEVECIFSGSDSVAFSIEDDSTYGNGLDSGSSEEVDVGLEEYTDDWTAPQISDDMSIMP